jgi:UDP-N-acetylglucosamine diphosphorylase/glucosamine-1-phosphate N-acetyltransferase
MSSMRVCLFEDRHAGDLEPLTLTRPVFALLCGCTRLAEKHYRAFAATGRGALVRSGLAEVCRQEYADVAVNDSAWLRAGPVVLVNGRWLPPAPPALPDGCDPCVGLVDDEVAYVLLGPDLAATVWIDNVEESLDRLRRLLPARPAGGQLLRHLWELVDHNADEITLDTWLSSPERPRRHDVPLALMGPADRLHIDPTARIEPLVAADTTGGPVVIDREAVVAAFTRLEGPCYIGPGTQVLGARVRAGTSLGPLCRVGGEVEASIVLGHSNKYHDGFLGHAYVGEWVNLGAGTSNSDLRNDYGEVRVQVNGQLVATGRSKVGCFLGDHTKSGLGTLLNTGTSAGVFCNLLPSGGLLPRSVPSFAGVNSGALVENSDIDALLRTADKVMRRRGQTLTEAQRTLYRALVEQTASARRQAIREAEARRLRRSA